jgi:hypothetical protein
MRRLVLSIIMASGLVMVGAGSASAAPAPTAAAKPVPGKKVCKISDPVLNELSGMVATEKGFVVINDSSPTEAGKKVFFLTDKCKIDDSKSYSGNGPRDTEDLAQSPDGKTLWIADVGDNDRDRGTVGLWSMPSDGSKQPKIHRFSYPDGDKHDSEALLLNGDGTPIIVTKEVGRPAGLYVPASTMKTENTEGVPLKRVGEIAVPPSTTPTGVPFGRGSIDGGAVSPDGSRVALRTYSDALEWDVTGGDVLAALKGKPRVTPLPNERQGETIAYTADGKEFLTVSDMQGETGEANWILKYTPTAKAATTLAAPGGAAAKSGGPSWLDKLSLDDITYLVSGVGLLGAVLVGLGIFGIVRARRRPSKPEPAGGKKAPKDPAGVSAAATELIDLVRDEPRPSGDLQGAGQRGGPAVYGGGRPPAPPAGPGVYGAKPVPAGPPPSGGVYGVQPARPGQPPARPGPPGGGGVYGAPAPAPARPPGPAARPAGPSGRPTGFFPDGGRDNENGRRPQGH